MERRRRVTWSWRALSVAAVLALVVGACGDDGGGQTASTTADTVGTEVDPYDGHESDLYADGDNWLCRPDRDDVCDSDLDATVVRADGSTEIEPFQAAEDPAADCFYVYPTVSADPGDYADLEPGREEEVAALNQAARFSSVCRVFAPLYRQLSLAGLSPLLPADGPDEIIEANAPGYEDVLDAWRHYVSNDNQGRPVVLIGHSQGAADLSRLVAEEIDGVPDLQDRLVAALLLGWPVAVPDGEDVGGDFAEIPICTEETQTGCVLSYSTFRHDDPPVPGSLFARAEGSDRAACTNPGAVDGGEAGLSPYFPTPSTGPSPFPFDTILAEPFAPTATDPPEITTPFVTYPDLLSAECVRDGEFDYLAVTVDADPTDARTDDIGGEIAVQGFGLHMADVNAAMGDLVALVSTQIDTHTGG